MDASNSITSKINDAILAAVVSCYSVIECNVGLASVRFHFVRNKPLY